MMKALLSRKSIRKYTQQPVGEETVHDLLHAAMSAPSAGNQKPWHFVVITSRTVLDAIPSFHPYAGMLKEAPLAIAVCGNTQLGPLKDFWVQDCAAATQNILTAAVEKELGAVWLGIHPIQNESAARNLLNLPEHIIPFSLVAIGYPAESISAGDRYDASRVHYNHW